jgi:hypothetical protein
MNLNITLEDLKGGQYEAQKKLLLHRLVQKRAIMKDPESGSLPPKIVRSDLLNWMLEACGDTGVVVVHADRGLGKSTAAKFILKHSAGGVMFCNCISTSSEFYWKGVAKALGIPKEVYENDSDWEELLVTAVAAATSPEALETESWTWTWTDRLMEGFLSICSGDQAIERDSSDTVPLPTIAGLDLSLQRKRPIIVFDDFNDVKEEDIRFMKHLYPIVKAKGVLLFVLVRDEATANQLLKLNGWGRIAPLVGSCRNTSAPGAKERTPEWTPIKWTRAQLEEIVRSNFGEVPNNMPEIEDGANPLEILDEARRRALRL